MIWATSLIAFLVGVAVGRTLPFYCVLQPQPMRIVEAELLSADAIDAAVRGD
jgi:hypothetical protein